MGAPDLLRHLRAAGFTLEPADAGIRVAPSASLTDADRQAIRDNRTELLSLLALLGETDRWCWPRSDAMNGAELAEFAERARRFTRRGMSVEGAEEMADRLLIRDRDQDDRRTCWECGAYRSGRCGNHRHAGLHSSDVGATLAAMLQRCPGFNLSR